MGFDRRLIAAPDDVQVRPQQDEIVAVNIARRAAGDVENVEGGAIRREGPSQRRRIRPGGAEAKQRVARPQAILQGGVAVEPDVRQTGTRPGGWHILARQVLGPARLLPDDRRADVAVAQLGADHLVGLALLYVGHCGEMLSGRLSLGGLVADIRPILAAPLAPAERGIARGADVAIADLPALDFVGGEKVWAAPAAQGAGELP